MSEPLGPEALRQLAAEGILEAANLTDELTDGEAKPLIAWAVSQAEAAVDAEAVTGLAAADLASDDLREMVANRVTPVRRTMKILNSLATDRRDLSPDEVVEELQYLLDKARKLPEPPVGDLPDARLADLAGRQGGMDNGTFVQAVLALLGAGPAAQIDKAEQTSMTGEKHDKAAKEADDEQQAPGAGRHRGFDRLDHHWSVVDADEGGAGSRSI